MRAPGRARARVQGRARGPCRLGAVRPPRAPASLALAALCLGAAPARAADPFEHVPLPVQGRPVQVFAVDPGAGARGADLVVVCVEGAPPDERRHLWVLRAAALGAGGVGPALRVPVPPEAVAFDLADLDPAPGLEVVLLSRNGLEIVSPAAPAARVVGRISFSPPAPLPPRTRSFSRMRLVDDWSADGGVAAAVPSLEGARLVRLDGASQQTLELPIVTEYWTPQRGPPAYDGILEANLQWPQLARADDDGDGRPDVFALGRYGAAVFRANGERLGPAPSRAMPLRPFSPEEELRPETTRARLFARDLDGDGLGDLVVHRSSGTLLGSYASTEIHRNPGGGAELARPAEVRLEAGAGVADVDLADLDGDGRVEVVQSLVSFGLVQVLRFLTTRRVEVELSVWALRPPGISRAERVWQQAVALPVDFGAGRVEGLLPTAEGDWNGDGRRDLLYGVGAGEIAIHLGAPLPAGPGFGERVASQAIPPASWAVVADVDGDGLDDLIVYDDFASEGVVHLLRNRGILPGTQAGLRAP